MQTITFVCPYFGKLPEDIMPLWLESCKYNETIKWIVFTDDRTKYNYPDNVHVIYMTLKDVKKRAQRLFEFPIYLSNPYKLCDFKPLYGCIFHDYLSGVDFWGHCDMSDIIMGDLRKFFTEEILNQSEKILFLGHMTLYRNTESVNNRFRIKTKSDKDIREIFASKENMAFDELKAYSINSIYIENGFKLTRIDDMYKDISCMRYSFMLSSYNEDFVHNKYDRLPRIFVWEKGHLYDCWLINNEVMIEEIGYVHFQKRKMINHVSCQGKDFYILPNGFYDIKNEKLIDVIKSNSKIKILYMPYWINKIKAIKYRIRHMR